ncbi:MAG TPA: hypothetical protein DCX03_00770 [Bacteroidales bacterium]|nr:hypothetical protein [Bacteroidales bacterium]
MVRMEKLQRLLSLNPLAFVYYNFFCRNIIRDKGKYIFPNWGSRIELNRTAKIYLHAHMMLNVNKYPYSNAECYLRLRRGAEMKVNGKVSMFYGGTIEVHNNAKLNIGSCSVQTGTVIICAYLMTIGQGCLISRMAYISDSDHHRVFDDEGNITNWPKETIIGDNVWIGVKATVMKGAKIKSGSAIGANTVVGGRVKEHTFIMEEPPREFGKINWSTEGFPEGKNSDDRQ